MNKKMFSQFMQVACELVIAEIFVKFGIELGKRDMREWTNLRISSIAVWAHLSLTVLSFGTALLFLWLAYQDFKRYLEARKEWKAEAK